MVFRFLKVLCGQRFVHGLHDLEVRELIGIGVLASHESILAPGVALVLGEAEMTAAISRTVGRSAYAGDVRVEPVCGQGCACGIRQDSNGWKAKTEDNCLATTRGVFYSGLPTNPRMYIDSRNAQPSYGAIRWNPSLALCPNTSLGSGVFWRGLWQFLD